ncbi:transposase-like protein, partial [Brachionus plicatilis]
MTDKDTNLVKYFLTSNTAIAQLKNPYLRALLITKLPHPHTFTKSILPRVFKKMKKNIEVKLKEAVFICLIVDLWTNPNMVKYLAICASMVYKNFAKELRVIGMERMQFSNSESIKEAIEKCVNKYEFDKTKIAGVVCDQDSALVRLFRQNENLLFDEFIENADVNANGFEDVDEADDVDLEELSNEQEQEQEQEQAEPEHNADFYRFDAIDEEIDRIAGEID